MYTSVIESKTGSKIPLFGAISFHSKYNPEREAESFAQLFQENSKFFIVLGIAGGFHINSILDRFPDCKIIAYETLQSDIDFLLQIDSVKKLSENKNVHFATSETLSSIILGTYKPVIHGNLSITGLRQWEVSFNSQAEKARKIIQDTVKQISQDFSVQSHFGKLWHKNILKNLKILSKIPDNYELVKSIPADKTAAIIAAGPSLDKSCNELMENRNDFFVIATDTAYSSLISRGIECDAVISVDGQMISYKHYIKKTSENTIFVFDLCANSSAVKKIIKTNRKIIFSQNGHPLALMASTYDGNNYIPKIETGSGTVTIAAADFAIKCGFRKIKFFGADFSYSKGKPYTKGTYLDSIYRTAENKLDNAESMYSGLLFRTELKKISENTFTTEILDSYRVSAESFMLKYGFRKEKEIYIKNFNENSFQKNHKKFNYADFCKYYQKLLENELESKNISEETPALLSILPLAAYIEKKEKKFKKDSSINSTLIAYSKALVYTSKL